MNVKKSSFIFVINICLCENWALAHKKICNTFSIPLQILLIVSVKPQNRFNFVSSHTTHKRAIECREVACVAKRVSESEERVAKYALCGSAGAQGWAGHRGRAGAYFPIYRCIPQAHLSPSQTSGSSSTAPCTQAAIVAPCDWLSLSQNTYTHT